MAGHHTLRTCVLAFLLTTFCELSDAVFVRLHGCSVARVVNCNETGVAFARGRLEGFCPFREGYTCQDLSNFRFYDFLPDHRCSCDGASAAFLFGNTTCASNGRKYMACNQHSSSAGDASQDASGGPSGHTDARKAGGERDICPVDRFRVLTQHEVLPTYYMSFHSLRDDIIQNQHIMDTLVAGGVRSIAIEAGELPCRVHTCCTTNIYIRPKSTDWEVFTQVFRSHSFRQLYPYLANVKYALDAGGNVGFTSVLFALWAPEAKILMVEPDAENLRMATMNTVAYEGVKLLQAAVWSKDTKIAVSGSNGEWSYTFKETTDDDAGGIPAFSIPSLLSMSRWPRLDLAKIDIEGAEGVVFGKGADTTWVAGVPMLAVGLHDKYAKRYGLQEVKQLVMSVADQYAFEKVEDDEHLYLIRKDLVHQ